MHGICKTDKYVLIWKSVAKSSMLDSWHKPQTESVYTRGATSWALTSLESSQESHFVKKWNQSQVRVTGFLLFLKSQTESCQWEQEGSCQKSFEVKQQQTKSSYSPMKMQLWKHYE